MSLLDQILGKALATDEAEQQQVGPAAGISLLGLDALSSAAYGPEAALTLLLPLGAAGLHFVAPIIGFIVAILLVVYFSYRQTIEAYPNGGGSYTVARENLGPRVALFAGAALALDYVLNVAVGISAGVGALVSAVPTLLPHTLALCLATLCLITLVNLRGVRESGLAFMVPTYTFVATLVIVMLVGLARTFASGGHPTPVVAPPPLPRAVASAGIWIVVRAFASGCTAMTGVEAVSNGVPLFRAPTVRLAQRTLTLIIAILVALLIGVASLCAAYGIGATEPGRPGYQSILSTLVGAIMGRGAFYYVTIASIVAVLTLSANTSFSGFPRLCRVLSQDRYLPDAYAVRGRRLVYSRGLFTLALLSGALLLAFGGITDRLIPLFAIGALLAFTLSQAGMVQHWRRAGVGHRRSLAVNAVGAIATGATLIIVAISKFTEGAWLTLVVVPLLVALLQRVNRHYRQVAEQILTLSPMEMPRRESPIVVVTAASWSKLTQHGLKFALRLSTDVHVVQVRTETDSIEDLSDNWELLITSPARAADIPPPKLTILTSSTRRFFGPFLDFVNALEREQPERDIVVVIPDLVLNHWYEGILHNHRGAVLRTLLRVRCGPRVVIVDTPFHLQA
jgi:amino acid transporter